MSMLTDRIFKEIESSTETIDRVVNRDDPGGCAGLWLQAKDKARGTYIRHTPGVCGGEACVRNTRVAAWMLESAQRAGVGDAELLLDYPDLTRQDLGAAWLYVEGHGAEIETGKRRHCATDQQTV